MKSHLINLSDKDIEILLFILKSVHAAGGLNLEEYNTLFKKLQNKIDRDDEIKKLQAENDRLRWELKDYQNTLINYADKLKAALNK